MGRTPLTDFTTQGDWNPHGLPAILRELQGFTISVIEGDVATAHLAFPQFNPDDQIISVLCLKLSTVASDIALDDVTSEIVVTPVPGYPDTADISFATRDTTGCKLIVFWRDKEPPE
jgi:hypothetical protein